MIALECSALQLSRLTIEDVDAHYALVDRNRGHFIHHGNDRDMQTATRETVREELKRPNPFLCWVPGMRIR